MWDFVWLKPGIKGEKSVTFNTPKGKTTQRSIKPQLHFPPFYFSIQVPESQTAQ
jgi:hypothetical protein